MRYRTMSLLGLLYPALALGSSDAGAPPAASDPSAAAPAAKHAPANTPPASSAAGTLATLGDGMNEYQGVVELEERQVAFEFGGRLKALHVDRGQELTRGELVAELDPTLEEQARASRSQELAAATAELELLRAGTRADEIRGMEARVRAARVAEAALDRKVTRERALLKDGVGLDAVVDDVQGQRDRAVADREALEHQLRVLRAGARSQQIDGARARLEAAEVALGLSDLRLERYRAVSPLDATVLEVHFRSGEIVPAGAAVATLGDRREPYVDVFVPEGRLAGVSYGLPARVRVDAIEAPFSAFVENVARRTEFTPRYLFSERERPNLVVRVRVRIRDPKAELPIGVPARVELARPNAAGGEGKP